MACTSPNYARRYLHTDEPWESPPMIFMGKIKRDGLPKLVTDEAYQGTYDYENIELPCGQCDACRLERSRQWAVRCIHEASLYEDNCFITLTYDDQHLPHPNTLHLPHFQKFLKRLRKRIAPASFRYYACGEYGERFHRPHYHACLFGYDFPDKVQMGTRHGLPVWRSQLLEATWPKGRSQLGTVTFDSAAYVARYIMKKVNGPEAYDHYKGRDPEWTTMSRGGRGANNQGGIGRPWLRKWQTDVFPRDSVIVRGMPTKPPRYYDVQVELSDPALMVQIKEQRRKTNAAKVPHTLRSRDADAHILTARLNQRRRELE